MADKNGQAQQVASQATALGVAKKDPFTERFAAFKKHVSDELTFFEQAGFVVRGAQHMRNMGLSETNKSERMKAKADNPNLQQGQTQVSGVKG